MRSKEFIKEDTEDTVVQGPWKKTPPAQPGLNLRDLSGKTVQKPVDISKMKKVPLYKAFGGPEYSSIRDAGFKFDEKPDYFESIKSEINVRDLPKIEQLIGRKLNSYKAEDLLDRYKDGSFYPQVPDTKFENLKDPDEETFIVWFPETNDRFLVNRTGATKYIRMWAHLVD